ncbi:hypothetical protein HPB49_004729 [Dermacentor silvarum]|uniref:Uncharacterized protein n=1 Tax=Dermacentor silvarum TaxID=543639 RepID=A0ACB8DU85_DERSI|nr:hypothetical protein HPB49_004729 [Dermacentor silvarum]
MDATPVSSPPRGAFTLRAYYAARGSLSLWQGPEAGRSDTGDPGRHSLPGPSMRVSYRRPIEIDIEPNDKVERIKERVEEKEGIPPAQQRLIYSGKQM